MLCSETCMNGAKCVERTLDQTSSTHCSVPHECPAEIEKLIEDCLSEEVDDRPTMKEVFDRLKKADPAARL